MTRLPHDRPTPERAHRVYAALTNSCNRSCPWCSTCSSPSGSTFLTPEALIAALPQTGAYELQLEGGEPTIHPRFWDFVRLGRGDARCARLVRCTNGAALPRARARLRAWLERLGAPLTLKLSINHHLLDADAGLLALAGLTRDLFQELGGARALVFNVRLRRGVENDDARVLRAVKDAGLEPQSNVFFLQRYGFADQESSWDAPFLAGTNFRLVNPDGRAFGPDLIGRSEAMRELA
jgi:hypothetical protein